jgi:hypothetical protein
VETDHPIPVGAGERKRKNPRSSGGPMFAGQTSLPFDGEAGEDVKKEEA